MILKKMKYFTKSENHLYVSNKCFREERKLNRSLDLTIDNLIWSNYFILGIGGTQEQEKFLDFCKAIKGKKDFSVGILNAHGNDSWGNWQYRDGIWNKKVQNWVDEFDGQYDLLLLSVCNPKARKPKFKESWAVVPSGDVGNCYNHLSLEHLLVIPGLGAIPFNREKIKAMPDHELLMDLKDYR